MEIIIRPAVNSDIKSILEIVNHAILNTTSNYNEEPQSLEIMTEWFTQKKAHNFPVIVAELSNQVIGYGAYGTFREKIGYRFTVEHSVYIQNDYIGKGIGKLLLADLIRIARIDKVHVMIGAIDAENLGSIAFHKGFGFTECGVVKEAGWKFNRWLDLQFMQLLIK